MRGCVALSRAGSWGLVLYDPWTCIDARYAVMLPPQVSHVDWHTPVDMGHLWSNASLECRFDMRSLRCIMISRHGNDSLMIMYKVLARETCVLEWLRCGRWVSTSLVVALDIYDVWCGGALNAWLVESRNAPCHEYSRAR